MVVFTPASYAVKPALKPHDGFNGTLQTHTGYSVNGVQFALPISSLNVSATT